MAIANRTFRGEVHDAPRLVFASRLMTLSKAHDALTASDWDRTGIVQIIKGALEPHQFDQDRVLVCGPDLDLAPKQALALALAINELATNASKYGALSNPSGTVQVTWSCEDSEFIFAWRETGGPAVVPPAREGFGTRVIKSSLADDFGGAVELTYEAAGFVCVLTAPLECLPKAPVTLQMATTPG
jgi:two-component sensor histidine kinase